MNVQGNHKDFTNPDNMFDGSPHSRGRSRKFAGSEALSLSAAAEKKDGEFRRYFQIQRYVGKAHLMS